MVASLPVLASFNYWATTRHPAITEVYSVANGTVDDIQPHTSEVRDIRTANENFTLDKNGFTFIKHQSRIISPSGLSSQYDNSDDEKSTEVANRFQDIDFVCQNYWPEVCAALREYLTSDSSVAKQGTENSSNGNGTSRSPLLVIPLQTAMRTSVISKFTPMKGPNRMSTSSPPAKVVHNDYSPYGARNVLRSMLTTYLNDIGIADMYSADDKARFLRQRERIIQTEDEKIQATQSQSLRDWDGKGYEGPKWAIYSVWRPFETVRRDPIGVIDASSMFDLPQRDHRWEETYMPAPFPHKGRVGFVPEYEMVTMTHFTPGMTSGTKDQYHWYYMKEQKPDDLLIIKLFDSEAWKDRESGVAPCSAHSAFELDGQDTERPRRSIEVRVLVIW